MIQSAGLRRSAGAVSATCLAATLKRFQTLINCVFRPFNSGTSQRSLNPCRVSPTAELNRDRMFSKQLIAVKLDQLCLIKMDTQLLNEHIVDGRRRLSHRLGVLHDKPLQRTEHSAVPPMRHRLDLLPWNSVPAHYPVAEVHAPRPADLDGRSHFGTGSRPGRTKRAWIPQNCSFVTLTAIRRLCEVRHF